MKKLFIMVTPEQATLIRTGAIRLPAGVQYDIQLPWIASECVAVRLQGDGLPCPETDWEEGERYPGYNYQINECDGPGKELVLLDPKETPNG